MSVETFQRFLMLPIPAAGVAMLLTTSWLLREFGTDARFLRYLPPDTTMDQTTWIAITIASGLVGFGTCLISCEIYRYCSRYWKNGHQA